MAPAEEGGSLQQAVATERRPIAARNARWIRRLASWLGRRGVRPNQVSIASILFAVLTAVAMLLAMEQGTALRIGLLAVAGAGLAGRGLCNLLDGLIAIEGGRRTSSGEIYNELPDRVSDVLMLVAAGYAASAVAGAVTLGWLASVLAVTTAYVRVLGASAGTGHDFRGPMAKTGRMLVIALGLAGAATEPWWQGDGQSLAIALAVICVGGFVTIARRASRLIRNLESR